VFQWQKPFKDGDKRVVAKAQSRRTSTVITDVNTDKVEQLLKEDRRLSLRKLHGTLNVSLERVHHAVGVWN
jgi:hypothetical protein